jgi:uncharacterized repeat protein (TIGR01451 family)
MNRRFTAVLPAFRSGLCAEWKAGVRRWAIAITTLLFVLVTQSIVAATAPDTVISNTAIINFQLNTVNALPQSSNSNVFTVLEAPNLNQGTATITGADTSNFFPGNSSTLNIEISNDGSNVLENGNLHISTPVSVDLVLTGTNVALQSQNTVNEITTYVYNIGNLAVDMGEIYIANLSVAIDAQITSNDIIVNYRANNIDITRADTTLNLSMRTQGVLQLLQYSQDKDATRLTINPTEFMQSDGSYVPTTPPIVEEMGVSVISTPIPVKPTAKFNHRQIVFIKLEDADHNIDRITKETIDIAFNIFGSGESERLKLVETDVNSGIFSGYVTLALDNPVINNNGVLSVYGNTEITVSYSDDIDNTDSSIRIILIDPYGLIFDSATGALLNGYSVELINADTGIQAQVFGDDGISSYPATMVTGGTVSDSSGKTYNFADGAYRFPFAPAGNYKLLVTPPTDATYVWPSEQSLALINQLPDAPYAITLGSRGETFPLQAGIVLHIDIPVDFLDNQLYIRRSASKTTVAPGDFIHYTVTLENVTNETVNKVILTDILPHGFRLETHSIMVNGSPTTAPVIAADGGELTFNLDSINAGDIHTVEYVVAVGAAKRGIASSSSDAIANNGTATSNTAKVDTQVAEELMRSRAILMGQVIIENDRKEAKNSLGLKGVRIYMEDGRYAITDERGMYHFENIMPGSHVVQLDLDTLPKKYEAVFSKDNTRFAGRAWSQFVDVQGGTLWRSDFHVALKPKPQGTMSLQISNSTLLDNSDMEYHVAVHSETVAIDNMRLTVMIPEHTKYKIGSSTFGDKEINDPVITRNMLTFRLGAAEGDWNKKLSFVVSGVAQGKSPELLSKAFIIFNTPEKQNQRTPVVNHAIMIETTESIQRIAEKFALGISFDSGNDQISIEDKQRLATFSEKIKMLKNIRIHAVGHSDNKLLRPETKKRFGDNYKLSANRAMVIANELRDILRLTPGHITIEGRGPDEPIADNSNEKGRTINRRVHLYVYSDKISTQSDHTSIQTQSSERLEVATQGSHSGENEVETTNKQEVHTIEFNRQWLAQQTAGIKWLYPQSDNLPKIASTNIVIKHQGGQNVTLLINNEPVPNVNFDGILKNQRDVAISTWRGVDLSDGDNFFEAIISDESGNKIERISHTVHFSTDPVAAEIIEEQSILIADGITKSVIAIRLLDKDGYPARSGISGQFRIAPPYKAVRNHNFITNAMPGTSAGLHEYQTTERGIALIPLEPTTESGKVKISLPFSNDTTGELTVKLNAKGGDWILVGIAENTTGYNTLSENTAPLTGNAAQDHLYQDGRIAFFAKGQVLGKWLMTVAYDSDKKRPNNTDPELFQAIDPDSYYTLYGDTNYNGYAAASSKKLYLKLERDQFYFLFGDYQTGLDDTQLAKYNRTFTGTKMRYQDEQYDFIVFSSETSQAFVKDEFRGNGLTGPYQLTRNNVAMNSEKIIIEVRDRLRSEVIISTIEMSRHQDYQIDYRTGIINFRQPVFNTNQGMNPQYIVVKYESFGSVNSRTTYGGRAKTAISDTLNVGVTHISEGRADGEAKLSGVDMTYKISDKTKLYLEAARSIDGKETATNVNGNAYLAEIVRQTSHSNSKIYYRDQESGFGLGQINDSESGMRKSGIETTLRTTDSITVKGQVYRQKNTSIVTTRDVVEVEGRGAIGKTGVRMGVRSAHDLHKNGRKENAQQIIGGVSRNFIDDKITARIDREQNLSSGNSSDFPNRTRLGVDYRVSSKTTLFVEQDIADGKVRDTRSTLVGMKSTPWSGGEMYSGVKKSSGTQDNTISANVSVRQTWQLTDKWSMNIGAEEVKILSNTSTTPLNNNVPFASSGADEFTAGSMGITYMPGDWMWAVRFEARNGANEDRWQLASSVQTNPNTNLSTLTTLAHSNSEQATGIIQRKTDIHLGLAYRPISKIGNSHWIILNRLDLQWNDVSGGIRQGENWRAINNLSANYKLDQWQLSLQYAAKTVSESYNNIEYMSLTDLAGFETRYDLTRKWDAGLHSNILRAVKLNHYDYNTGVSVGHSMVNNIWLSLGYNFVGFRDEDFSRSNYTSKGLFLRFRMKFDQTTVRDAVKWAGQ